MACSVPSYVRLMITFPVVRVHVSNVQLLRCMSQMLLSRLYPTTVEMGQGPESLGHSVQEHSLDIPIRDKDLLENP